MARNTKWVSVESPDEPLAGVARRAVGDRLQLVWRYLKRSSNGSLRDTENLHQLRVSTRRVVAAMEIFSSLLPPRRAKWMSKQLKIVRQVGGDARNLDVMIARFAPLAEREVDGPYGAVVHRLKVNRNRAQDPIDSIYKKLRRRDFSRRAKALVKRIRLRDKSDRAEKPSFVVAAYRALAPAVAGFFNRGEADFADYAALHAFRIEGKHLRYIMEIFAGAFPPAFREDLYPLVAALQDRLGEINDHAMTHERFCNWLTAEDLDDDLRRSLNSLVGEEEKSLEAKRRDFLKDWTPAYREWLRNKFDALLSSNPSEATHRVLAPRTDPEDQIREFALRRAE